jgi:hypothetical protein
LNGEGTQSIRVEPCTEVYRSEKLECLLDVGLTTGIRFRQIRLPKIVHIVAEAWLELAAQLMEAGQRGASPGVLSEAVNMQ